MIPEDMMTAPIIAICMPYVIQSELEYMNDDSGPITDWPWKWNIAPKIAKMHPKLINPLVNIIWNQKPCVN